MITKLKIWTHAGVALLALLAGCSRDDTDQGIALTVIRETTVHDPFDGAMRSEQTPAANAVVYLVPFGVDGTASTQASDSRYTVADAEGLALFPQVEGRYRAWVDLDGDGSIDAKSGALRSGERATIVVGETSEGGESLVSIALSRETYHPGDTIEVTVWGNFANPHSISVEVWNDAATRVRHHAEDLGEFAGEFTASTSILAQADWPLTPNSRLADYIVVPRVDDAFHEGARFSLRRSVPSYNMSGLSMMLNNGDPVTNIRNVTANLTGQHVSTVALSEDPAALAAGAVPRLPFDPQVGYQLTAGDGLKTVYAMFYDIDGNYAGPISDSIYLDTQPVVPITGMSVEINYGAPVTNSRNVELALAATGATFMAFSENPAAFPNNVVKLPFATSAAYQLTAGDGLKTVWVMYYDLYGRYYGPVSDSIALDTSVPIPPVTGASIVINGGVPATNDRNVNLTLAANNATAMAFSEDPALFPNGVIRYPFSTDFGWRLTAGDGPKTLWAMFFDAGGNYYTPVSASINLVTQPTTPITNMSIVINGGATGTAEPNLTVTLTADNAFMMAITEVSGTLPYQAVRYPFSNTFGYSIKGGEGLVTLWAMFYDVWGNYAGPVSASIVYDRKLPRQPDASLLYVTPNPPGMHDFLSGYPGAVPGNSLVTVYRDPLLQHILTQGYADADGSFSMLNIGDGSAGNVFKPQDWVFVTASNEYGNESTAAIVENDSTPPEIRPEDIDGIWETDLLGPGVGNVGDVFAASYIITAATDVVGGEADLSQLGGPSAAPLVQSSPGVFTAHYTVPPELVLDHDKLSIRIRVVDDFYNYSPWVESEPIFAVDTVPPDPVNITSLLGGNQQLEGQWADDNLDSISYSLVMTSHTGLTVETSLPALDYCAGSGNVTRACIYQQTGVDAPSAYFGHYLINDVDNCNHWSLMVQVVDDGGNVSPFSTPVSAYVTLPPPNYEIWSGISEGSAMLAFGVSSVMNASAYELAFSTATGAPYEYDEGTYDSPFTFSALDPNGLVMRFPGLPTNTVFYTSSRSIDDSGAARCFSEYATEITARTELYVVAVTDGTERTTIGGALAAVRDVDNDGFTDIVAGAPHPQHAMLVSGNNGASLGTFGTYLAPDSYDIPGTPLAAGNIDGPVDAAHEYIVGSPLETAGGKILAGRVRVYDHDRTTVLAQFDGSEPGQQFGFSVTTVRAAPTGHTYFAAGGFGCAHRDCGNIPNIVAATEGPGRVVLFDGQSLSPLRTFDGNEKGDYFGVALAGGKDLTGDGIPDFVIGAPGSGFVTPGYQIHIVSGDDWSIVHSIDLSSSFGPNARPGAALTLLDDITGDGVAELAVGIPSRSSEEAGAVLLLSGQNFGVIWGQFGAWAHPANNFGATLASGGDVNGDGIPDLIVGAPANQQNFFYGAGSAFVLDGFSGKILYEFKGWSDEPGRDGSIGYSLLLPGNIRGGPRSEWVVGAPGSAYGGYQSGRIYILSTDW